MSAEPPAPDGGQHLADASLITHAAAETSQAARDNAETQLQHRSEELVGEQSTPGRARDAAAAIAAGPSDAGPDDAVASRHSEERRDSQPAVTREASVNAADAQSVGGAVLEAPQPEPPPVLQQPIDTTGQTQQLQRQESITQPRDSAPQPDATAPAPTEATSPQADPGNKRKRAAPPKPTANKRARHLQTSGEITLASLESEVQQSVENEDP
ncbi:MAG: hypothetical protein INR71_00930, partial [Terriglobus roseus]|nr:hypothetical protein [Terriglobus roseus]